MSTERLIIGHETSSFSDYRSFPAEIRLFESPTQQAHIHPADSVCLAIVPIQSHLGHLGYLGHLGQNQGQALDDQLLC